MNQYPPGFVPMMMPQPYMVAVRLPPGAGIPQPQRAQAAATTAAFLPGMPLAAASRFPTAQPGSIPGVVPALTTAQTNPVMTPTPQMLQLDPNSLKLAYSAESARASALGAYAGLGELQLEQPVEKPIVKLDTYNSDLNLVLDEDGYGAYPLTEPSGFCFTWAGVRSTHGVCKGKVYFEIQITEQLTTDFGDDHQETDPHIMRIGWSTDDTTFQLGEEPESYGYGGTGKFSKECKFSNYGERFGLGDIIGALLDMDSRPPTLSYMKNGAWLGIACSLQGFPAGTKEKSLFPHLLSKNCRFRVNFGQEGTWYPPPPGYVYMQQTLELVPGSAAPEKKSDCEMIMIIGLPGAGKTTWGVSMRKNHPHKKYNIIGTDTLIDKMRVMGLPRKNNYHGRWDVLIDKATKCLNKMFDLAKTRHRNYILDQTNVYPSARKRKMKNFQGFFRRAVIVQPDDPELIRRSEKRTEEGKFVPESAVLEMKANFRLPDDNDPLFDSIEYVELGKKEIQALLDRYNRDGQQSGPPRQGRFGQNKPFQPPADLRQVAPFSNQSSNPPLPPNQYGNPYQQSQYGQAKSQEFGQHGRQGDEQRFESHSRQGRHPAPPGNRESEPASKRGRFDASSGGNSSALDLLKQEYAEEEPPPQPQMPPTGFLPRQPPPPKAAIKQEPQWNRGDMAWAAQYGMQTGQALLQGYSFPTDGTTPVPPMPSALAGAQFAPGQDFGAQGIRGLHQQFSQSATLSQPPPPPPEQPNVNRGWQGPQFNTNVAKQTNVSDSRNNQQSLSNQMEQIRNVQNQWQQNAGYGDQTMGFQGNQQDQNQRQMQQQGGYGSQTHGFGNQQGGRQNQQFGGLQNQQDAYRRQDHDSFRQQSNSEQGGGYGNQQSNFRNQSFDNRSAGNQSKQNPNTFERNRYGRNFDTGDNRGQMQQQQQHGGTGFGNFADRQSQTPENKRQQSPEKPKRERRRPSKWDTPSESSPSPTPTPAESGVSEEVMAKVAAIQQNLQQHIEEQQQQEQQQQSNAPNEDSSRGGAPGWQQHEQDSKQDMQGGPRMGNRWGGQDQDRQGGRRGGFGGNDGPKNMNMQRGGFGGWSPRPMMGGRGGNGQRPPFRPPGDQQRFPGDRQRFGGPSGDQGFGGPHGGQRFGGPPGQNHGRGGPRHFHPRGPNDQGGMRGGRPFGGRGGNFGQRGMPRGGPRGGPGGRWPRPN